jgi:type IV secretory pathway TraG/TraD family ATPase VirD4
MQDLAFWIGKASSALACLMHAAALDHRTMEDVYRWAHRIDDAVPEQILAAHRGAADGWLGPIREIRKPGRTADSIRMTVTRALAWLADPAVAAAVTPGPGEGFNVADFVSGRSTLYMIGTGREEAPIAPLFRAFAEYVHAGAAFTGSLQPHGRLDPPLLMALDEVTQICPVPLPNWMADSAGKGILIVAVCHGLAQLESRWDDPGARAIRDTAGVKVILGGVSDPDTLERLSLLCGEIALRTHSRTRDEYGRRGQTITYEPVRVLPPELLRTLPEWRALILRTNLSPVVVRLRMAWRRHDYRRARRNGAAQWQSVTTSAVGRRPVRWRSTEIDELTALAGGSESWYRDEPEPQPPITTELAGQPTDPAPESRTENGERVADDAPPLPPRSAGDGPPGRPRRPWDPPASPEDRQ